MKTSLLIATYNWPEALELVLKSALNQTMMPTEVIIADDGSTEETKRVIAYYRKKFGTPLTHVWHEDKGFQKAAILNKAIAKSKGDYIIQVDGDCILHDCFVEDHIENIESGTYLYGSRVSLKKEASLVVLQQKKINFNVFSKGIKKRTRAIRSTILSSGYKKSPEFSNKYRGCNTSFFKSDFIAVNGYNENFRGWGREDSELALRFHNNGVLSKRIRYAGIVFHIWHKALSKDNLETNDSIEKRTIRDKIIRTEHGVDQYLDLA